LNVASQGYQQPEIRNVLVIVLLASLAIVLPGLQWPLFGWLHLFFPLLVFFLFSRYGSDTGKKLLLTAVVIACIVNLFTGEIVLFLFSSSMLIPGFVLHRSADCGESPSLSGLKGCLALAGGWLIVAVFASVSSEVSVYSQMLYAFDQALSEALEQYRQGADIYAETLIVIEATISQLKAGIPIIMPGIIGSLILFIVWLTMVLGNSLVARTRGVAVWPSFRQWVLPEKLIWAIIVMGAFVLIPVEPLPRIGINCVLLLSVIYCFQGLSITVFFMNKWKVPRLLRSFFYVMIVFQSLGTIVLLFFGIADIWVDFRKLKVNMATINE